MELEHVRRHQLVRAAVVVDDVDVRVLRTGAPMALAQTQTRIEMTVWREKNVTNITPTCGCVDCEATPPRYLSFSGVWKAAVDR